MFSYESNGYNTSQVNEYINTLKDDYERKLMNLQLKILENEKEMLTMKNAVGYNLDSAVEKARQIETSSKNIFELKYKQLSILDSKLAVVLRELVKSHPDIENNKIIKRSLQEFKNTMNSIKSVPEGAITAPIKTENDSIRLLLNKLTKRQEGPREVKEVKIERRPYESISGKTMIKPISDIELKEGENYDSLVDKFLQIAPETLIKPTGGFDLKEALNPTEDLKDIMKAFDFYTDENED